MATLKSVTVLAPAKLNLALDVVGLLPNGYHNLDMTMQAITLYERVVLRRSNTLSLSLPGSPVAANDSNTAIKAAIAFFSGCQNWCRRAFCSHGRHLPGAGCGRYPKSPAALPGLLVHRGDAGLRRLYPGGLCGL